MSRTRTIAAFTLAFILAGCASASDRFEEGLEAEGYGQYYEAAMRYVEALEKDRDMAEARDRLMEVGELAISQGMQGAERRRGIGDAADAGTEFLALDRLLGSARGVGVRLPTPADYSETRRSTFDAAIDELMGSAENSEGRGQWSAARSAYARIRDEFQPDADQRRASLDAESRMFLAWAQSEEQGMRYRSAFDRAASALAVSGGAPRDVTAPATALQERVLEAGTRFVAVFPVDMDPRLEDRGESDPALQLSDILELEHWRAPPPFLAVADPVVVRQLIRRYAPRGTAFRPERILEEVGSDYGVLIEIVNLTRSERNVREQVRTAQTEGGGTQRYTRQEGTQRYEIQVRVIIVDQAGREVENFASEDNESGPFERGVYDGDLRDLNLSRAESMLFDEARQAQARAGIEDRLIAQLAERIAGQVFERMLRRVP